MTRSRSQEALLAPPTMDLEDAPVPNTNFVAHRTTQGCLSSSVLSP